MKRVFVIVMLLLSLSGCSGQNTNIDRAIQFRNALLGSNGCTFDASVTADYGEKIYVFQMRCSMNEKGEISFEVTSPESIAGISGEVTDEAGKLTFDEQALMFELIADGQVTPVTAPWLLMDTLRSGYIKGCEDAGDGLHLQIDDSYAEDALHLDIWTDENVIPIRGEILWKGRRILSIDVENFTIL